MIQLSKSVRTLPKAIKTARNKSTSIWLDSVNKICEGISLRSNTKNLSFQNELRSKNNIFQRHRSSQEVFKFLLPPKDTNSEFTYTLVLDLDETLVHYDQILRQFRVRPHCRSFLRLMSQYFEIVVFTAAQEDYANFILDQLDPTGEMIRHRLFRQHVIIVDG